MTPTLSNQDIGGPKAPTTYARVAEVGGPGGWGELIVPSYGPVFGAPMGSLYAAPPRPPVDSGSSLSEELALLNAGSAATLARIDEYIDDLPDDEEEAQSE